MALVLQRYATLSAAALAALGLSCPQTTGPSRLIREPAPVTEHAKPALPSLPAAAEPLPIAPVAPAESDPAPLPMTALLAEPSPDEPVIDEVVPLETAVESPSPHNDETANADEAEPREREEAEPRAAKPSVTGDGPFELVATRQETWVLAKPTWTSRKIGYLRAGAVVQRRAKPAGFSGCKRGWYRIEPEGFVCVGKYASLDVTHPVVEAAAKRPDRVALQPYVYAMSESPTPPRYVRLPTEEEQRAVEPDLDKHLRQKRDLSGFATQEGPVPGALLYEHALPVVDGRPRSPATLFTGRPVPRSGFGLLDIFTWTDRMFGVTTDLAVVPLDRTRFVPPSTMHGLLLLPGQQLPVAFVRTNAARRYRVDLETRTAHDVGPIAYREGFSLTGSRVTIGEHVYLETLEGVYIRRTDRVVMLPPLTQVPGWAQKGRKWIDVSILRQTLVAYEGTQPVFATLVSTGADGLGDPKETHSTVRGAFVIHTKHVTATMDSDEEGDVYDLRDVPYVQYFTEGYALHGAYWHDGFGTPRSHGCINLSPSDAAWLFGWTDPQVPEGWHGRLQLHGGTLVYTHP